MRSINRFIDTPLLLRRSRCYWQQGTFAVNSLSVRLARSQLPLDGAQVPAASTKSCRLSSATGSRWADGLSNPSAGNLAGSSASAPRSFPGGDCGESTNSGAVSPPRSGRPGGSGLGATGGAVPTIEVSAF